MSKWSTAAIWFIVATTCANLVQTGYLMDKLREINNRQKTVVVKQHQAITDHFDKVCGNKL